jgi:hypothetical protein
VGGGSAPSTFLAAYGGDGQLTSQTYPNGLVATTRFDNSGGPTSLTYAKSGSTWMTFTEMDSIYGQGSRRYKYDPDYNRTEHISHPDAGTNPTWASRFTRCSKESSLTGRFQIIGRRQTGEFPSFRRSKRVRRGAQRRNGMVLAR